MRLKNKVAIVTGGARAMRDAETRLFATESTKLIVADVSASDAESSAADTRTGGGEANGRQDRRHQRGGMDRSDP
jgi:NAD(P)-dependent dehydrogenase (short-subunit alcohol dehydrogenase family)